MMVKVDLDLVPGYRNNPLIQACGPLLEPKQLAPRLLNLPPMPESLADIPLHVRRHLVQSLWDLHIPGISGLNLASAIDEMIRQGYRNRRPGTPEFWRPLYQEHTLLSRPIGAAVMGVSGAGKSTAIERALALYPQMVEHERFPGLVSGFRQLIWLKIDAPESGKSVDLASNLMHGMENALGAECFGDYLERRNKRGPDMFRTWQKMATKHMLGILVIDEVQNLFKQETLAERNRRLSSLNNRRELRLIEDETLKLILSATNTWGIPILIAGTPDGMEAFSSRLSTAQRTITNGYHSFERIPSADDEAFKAVIFPRLCQYQWVKDRLPQSDEFRRLVFDLSAGVPRIYISLWTMAHRFAFDHGRDALSFDDFHGAHRKYLRPLIPAIEALKSDDPDRLFRYEDALPKSLDLWGHST